jgi:glycerol-1-phosphate dehydrogenase [NAD(P)+]
MDGFASASAQITENGFKTTRQAIQPDVIIADTAVLAASPTYLKSAGFGDMIAKYIALVDWRISNLLTGERYCQSIADLTREALKRITSLADKVSSNDEETAESIMESLIFTGVAMALANSVRPASGAEHMISHYWEMKKAEMGEISDFHGKKVGISTLYLTRLYHALANMEEIECFPHKIDFYDLKRVIGDNFINDVIKINSPSVTDDIDPKLIENNWHNIRKIVKEELPTPEQMLHLMKLANCATTPLEADIDNDLARNAMTYHPYLRHRLTLSHLVPLIKGADKVRSNILKEYYNI